MIATLARTPVASNNPAEATINNLIATEILARGHTSIYFNMDVFENVCVELCSSPTGRLFGDRSVLKKVANPATTPINEIMELIPLPARLNFWRKYVENFDELITGPKT